MIIFLLDYKGVVGSAKPDEHTFFEKGAEKALSPPGILFMPEAAALTEEPLSDAGE